MWAFFPTGRHARADEKKPIHRSAPRIRLNSHLGGIRYLNSFSERSPLEPARSSAMNRVTRVELYGARWHSHLGQHAKCGRFIVYLLLGLGPENEKNRCAQKSNDQAFCHSHPAIFQISELLRLIQKIFSNVASFTRSEYQRADFALGLGAAAHPKTRSSRIVEQAAHD